MKPFILKMVFSKKKLLKKSLDICYWNVNGIKSRHNGIRSISKLETREYECLADSHDIICVSEINTCPAKTDMQVGGFAMNAIYRIVTDN